MSCFVCKSHFQHNESMPIKKQGVTMHFGERFCLAEKRAKRFRSSDPKTKPPAWCPKKKSPHELRVYGFKDTESWLLHEQLCQALGRDLPPESHRYAVMHEGTTTLSAQEFLDKTDMEREDKLIGTSVARYHVVEIDDGLRPVCLYKTRNGYRNEMFFNTKAARENRPA